MSTNSTWVALKGALRRTDVSNSLDLGAGEMSRVAFPHLDLVQGVSVLDMAGWQLLVLCGIIVQRHAVGFVQC